MRLLILALLLCLNALAVINRYVNTASTAGGDGTTNATSGANRAWATLNEALTTLDNAPLTDDVTVFCSGSTADTTAITQIDVNTSTYTLTIQGTEPAQRGTPRSIGSKFRQAAMRSGTTRRFG